MAFLPAPSCFGGTPGGNLSASCASADGSNKYRKNRRMEEEEEEETAAEETPVLPST